MCFPRERKMAGQGGDEQSPSIPQKELKNSLKHMVPYKIQFHVSLVRKVSIHLT